MGSVRKPESVRMVELARRSRADFLVPPERDRRQQVPTDCRRAIRPGEDLRATCSDARAVRPTLRRADPVTRKDPCPTVLDFSHPHVLRTEEEYDAAIAEIEALLDHGAAAGTAEYERLEFLSVMAEAYEKVHYPVERVRPQDVVEFRLEQKGMDRADLRDAMGAAAEPQNLFGEAAAVPRADRTAAGSARAPRRPAALTASFQTGGFGMNDLPSIRRKGTPS